MDSLKREDIGVFSFGRKQSQRCFNKMLRSFADTTLTDIILKKLKIIGSPSFFAGNEQEFKDKCDQIRVPFVKRSQHSISIDEPITEILSFLKDMDYKYFLIVNGCLPFLKVSSIQYFINDCLENNLASAFAVTKRRNFYFDLERQPLNFSLYLKTINTKTVKPVYEFAHALYFFNKDYFFKNGRYWDWNEVALVELNDKRELIDIDTEEDFQIAQEIWKVYESDIYSL